VTATALRDAARGVRGDSWRTVATYEQRRNGARVRRLAARCGSGNGIS